MVILDTLIDFGCVSLVARRNIQSFLRIQKEKTELKEKVHRRICVRDITCLAARPPSDVIFCRFFNLLLPFRLLRFYAKKIFLLQLINCINFLSHIHAQNYIKFKF